MSICGNSMICPLHLACVLLLMQESMIHNSIAQLAILWFMYFNFQILREFEKTKLFGLKIARSLYGIDANSAS